MKPGWLAGAWCSLKAWTAAGKSVELKFRPADANDLNTIVSLIVTEAGQGHFNGDYALPQVAAGLRHQVACIIADQPVPMPGARNRVGGRALIIDVDGKDV
jgi:hypothetical protein